MSEKIYPKGMSIFAPRDGAPDFVKGKLIITPKVFIEWARTVAEHSSEYNGESQLKFDLLDGNKGLYATLDTFKPDPSKSVKSVKPKAETVSTDDDLPF